MYTKYFFTNQKNSCEQSEKNLVEPNSYFILLAPQKN